MSGWNKLPVNDSIRMLISDVLKDLGVSTNITGYYQLRTAIEYLLEDMSRVTSMTKILYVDVAKLYNTTPAAIERNIRHAIESSWARGNVDTQHKLFGYSVSMDSANPTVTQFVSTVADYIQLLRPEKRISLGRIKHTATNIADAHPVDEFKCSSCGVHLKDWTEVYFDIEDPDDEINREYVMKYCPECGHQIVEE